MIISRWLKVWKIYRISIVFVKKCRIIAENIAFRIRFSSFVFEYRAGVRLGLMLMLAWDNPIKKASGENLLQMLLYSL
ncbi:hypothetical protein B5F38_00350 [Barnesiella sp. An22]|nr:hypothetical protein B5F38_00350 [Barnesiella sp. An22]